MHTEQARAKINLNLHVGRLIDDPSHKYYGYHPLSSLVVFADHGDDLSCAPATKTELTICGPFSEGLEADQSNLILRAYEAVARLTQLPALTFKLIKNLPVASGIGGGSADAAAALRLMKHYAVLPEAIWSDIALSLGADVPVCLLSRTALMTGIGEEIEPLADLGQVSAVLINPRTPVSTGAVFRAFDALDRPVQKLRQPSGTLLERFSQSHNDLENIAAAMNADISRCLKAMNGHLCRMSGSGATCFALLPDPASAHALAQLIKQQQPHWWIQPVMLGESI